MPNFTLQINDFGNSNIITVKKVLFLITTLFIFTNIRAQTSVYHPFPDSNAVWNIEIKIYNGSMLCAGHPDVFQYSYVIIGDTVIGSYTYHKIFTPYVALIDTCGGIHSWGTTGYKGCFRQTIAARKIFYIAPSDSAEDLLYDFNLQIGDSIRGFLVRGCDPSHTPIVTDIDSILIGNNYHKRWLLNTSTEIVSPVIEGIGATDGLIEGLCAVITNISSLLMCYSHDSSVLYSSPPPWSSLTCDVINSVVNNDSKKSLPKIFPNPFHTTATFFVDASFENAELKIYNSLGEEVKHQFVNNKSTTINRDQLKDGIYFLQLINDKGQIATEKFVVD